MQLLHAQIPKVQQKTDSLTVFFALLESAHIKASCKTLMKLTPEFQRTKQLTLLRQGRGQFARQSRWRWSSWTDPSTKAKPLEP